MALICCEKLSRICCYTPPYLGEGGNKFFGGFTFEPARRYGPLRTAHEGVFHWSRNVGFVGLGDVSSLIHSFYLVLEFYYKYKYIKRDSKVQS